MIVFFGFIKKSTIFAVSKVHNTSEFLYGNTKFCPDGGIGRRAGLKHQWGDPCRFDPGSGYKIRLAIT